MYTIVEAQNVSLVLVLNNNNFINIDDVDTAISSSQLSVVSVRQAASSNRVIHVRECVSHSSITRSQPAPAQSNRSALKETRTIVLEIEKMNAESTKILAESFKLAAESLDRFTQMYCLQQAGAARSSGSLDPPPLGGGTQEEGKVQLGLAN